MKNTKILLVVDSTDDNSLELQQTLAGNGFKILDAWNIKEGFELTDYYDTDTVLVCHFQKVKTAYLDAIAKFVYGKPMPIIFFTNDDSSDAIDKSVKIGVNAYIVDGFSSERIKPIIEIATSRFNSYQQIARELHKTRQQLEDRKLIDKAKGLLMKSRKIDEQQAYESIRKMAMDKSKSMADIAQRIIDVMDVMI